MTDHVWRLFTHRLRCIWSRRRHGCAAAIRRTTKEGASGHACMRGPRAPSFRPMSAYSVVLAIQLSMYTFVDGLFSCGALLDGLSKDWLMPCSAKARSNCATERLFGISVCSLLERVPPFERYLVACRTDRRACSVDHGVASRDPSCHVVAVPACVPSAISGESMLEDPLTDLGLRITSRGDAESGKSLVGL